jgi:uncharacterized protein
MVNKQTKNPIILLLTTLIWVYQTFISPMLGKRCRFYPTCSSYAKEALTTFGLRKGLILTVKRIFKCHPFHPGGVDMIGETHTC